MPSALHTDGAIAIGSTLAEKLKVTIGDQVTAVVPVTGGADNDITTKTGRFTVGAIFESGVAFLDRDLVFMGLGNAQRFFGRELAVRIVVPREQLDGVQ